MSVLLVDWLGRGGIAQTTVAWMGVLDEAGVPYQVATRHGREIPVPAGASVSTSPRTRLRAHARIILDAVEAIRRARPEVVVIQNHVLPPLEGVVDAVARRSGCQVVRVVHDHRLHSRSAGTQVALRRLLARADLVIAHSHFVADAVAERSGREVRVLPLPLHLGGVADQAELPKELRGLGRFALQFGVLHRGYKRATLTASLAASGVEGWEFAMVGVGADPSPGVVAIDRFLDGSELAASVAASAASLFPYHFATQSGGVALAQSLGSIPIATAVGGVREQIQDGITGLLLGRDASELEWRAALARVADPDTHRSLTEAARAKALVDHDVFANGVRQVSGIDLK